MEKSQLWKNAILVLAETGRATLSVGWCITRLDSLRAACREP